MDGYFPGMPMWARPRCGKMPTDYQGVNEICELASCEIGACCRRLFGRALRYLSTGHVVRSHSNGPCRSLGTPLAQRMLVTQSHAAMIAAAANTGLARAIVSMSVSGEADSSVTACTWLPCQELQLLT